MEIPVLSHNSQGAWANNYKHFTVIIANLRELQGEKARRTNDFGKVSTAPMSGIVIKRDFVFYEAGLGRKGVLLHVIGFLFIHPSTVKWF